MSRKYSFSSARLNKVTEENDNLDAEIESLYQDLQSDSEDFEQNIPETKNAFFSQQTLPPKIRYRGTSKQDRLYSDSVEVLEKRTHRIDNTLDEMEASELLLPKPVIRIKGYRPPSERVYESVNKKKKFLKDAEREKNQKFNEEYTFRPEINEKSRQMLYDPNHLIENMKNEQDNSQDRVDPKTRFINERSERIAERTKSDFYSRQFRRSNKTHRKEESLDVVEPKKLSVTQQNDLIDRLSKPKEQVQTPQVSETYRRAKPSDPAILEHLVVDSFRKPSVPQLDDSSSISKMNPKSREMTKGISKDLFEESLMLQERQRKRAEEVKQWQDMAEAIECSFQPITRRSRMPTPRKTAISGMDDFLERMKKSQQERERKKKIENQEPPKHYRPSIIIAQPLSFEEREKREREMDKSVDAVLNEIDHYIKY